MLSVSEFLNSFNKNQLVIKISVQIDDFIELDYPPGSHIRFDDDSLQLTNCKVSTQNHLFIIEGTTKTGQEIKLFWGEKHYDLLKNTAPCTETITEFEVLKQQINTRECVNLNELHTVFLVVLKKELYTSLTTEQRGNNCNDTTHCHSHISHITKAFTKFDSATPLSVSYNSK